MTQQYLKHRAQKATGDLLGVDDWNLGADSASSAHVGGTGRGYLCVLATSDAPTYVKNQADYPAMDGTRDMDDVITALASYDHVLVLGKTFIHLNATSSDKIKLKSGQSLAFQAGMTISFGGDAGGDRHFIDIDGSATPVQGVLVSMRNVTLNLQTDSAHGVRIIGDVRDVLVELPRIVAVNPDTHADEGFSIVSNTGRGCRNIVIAGGKVTGTSNGNQGQGTDCVGGHDVHILGVAYDDCYNDLGIRSPAYQPLKVWFFDTSAGTYTDLANTYDGNSGTSANVTPDVGDYIYVQLPVLVPSLYFKLGATVNTNASRISAIEVSDGAGGWRTARLVRDESKTASRSLAQSGEIEWEFPDEDGWGQQAVNGVTGYWVRLSWTQLMTQVNVQEIQALNMAWGYHVERCVFESARNNCINTQGVRYSRFRGNTLTHAVNGFQFAVPTGNTRRSYGNTLGGNLVYGMSGDALLNDDAPGLEVGPTNVFLLCKRGIEETGGNTPNCRYQARIGLMDWFGVKLQSSRAVVEGEIFNTGRANSDAANPDNAGSAVWCAGGDNQFVNALCWDDQPVGTMTYGVRRTATGTTYANADRLLGPFTQLAVSASQGTITQRNAA